jgi:hypothetical protein
MTESSALKRFNGFIVRDTKFKSGWFGVMPETSPEHFDSANKDNLGNPFWRMGSESKPMLAGSWSV